MKLVIKSRTTSYVSVRGVFKDGEFHLEDDRSIPDKACRVLITFLEPVDENIDQLIVPQPEPVPFLTPIIEVNKAEIQILNLLNRGLTNRGIAQEVGLRDGTVRNYLSGLYLKFHADNRTQLILKAKELGLIEKIENNKM